MKRSTRILVANLSAPELRYLAAELARREVLLAYVCRYANQRRWWERALQDTPFIGTAYARSLGLRWVPEGLEPKHVAEAGVARDFAAAVLGRLGLPRAAVHPLIRRLHASAASAIGAKAARLASEADRIVAGVGMALPSFHAAAHRGIPRILNYPSAHHRFQHQFFAMHAEMLPEFASLDDPPSAREAAREPQFDEECATADMILTGSNFARQSFITEGLEPSRIAAIPYGVDTNAFRPGLRTEGGRFRIAYVGRISMRKGIGYLLQAYRRFRRADTDLHLVGSVVGDPACLRRYADLFTHAPHMPQSQLPQVYGEADVFVFPSLLEGLGLVVLEAMACGCPVIVTENGPGDVVRDGIDGFVVPAANAEAIEVALTRIYANPQLRQSMARSAREQAERYSWRRYANRSADLVLTHQIADTLRE